MQALFRYGSLAKGVAASADSLGGVAGALFWLVGVSPPLLFLHPCLWACTKHTAGHH